jgi:hypothetical protein
MKTITKITITSLMLSLFAGCSNQPGIAEDARTIDYNHFKTELTQKQIHKIIVKAGEEEGWRMTEFKENQIVAEKTEDDKTKAVSVIFSNEYFHLDPEDDDLEDAIEDAIEDAAEK